MATPVRRPSASVPATPTSGYTPAAPVPVVAPFGWILALSAGIGLVLATWVLYPIDYDGMWAGYRDGIIGTLVIIAAMWLRSSLPAAPALGLIGLCGVAAVLFAVFLDNSTKVFVAELAAGIVMLVSAAFQASALRD
ncbi:MULTISPECIES: hypothetical protein [unclassified Nocardioides]|uniref:hypothetical protein n=1 Tax=unclassified Nocardioides TaxID=2615069 RepID=UPI001055CB46|nr:MULTISPECIES: hypothetical protein [unclassified Nocardioides]